MPFNPMMKGPTSKELKRSKKVLKRLEQTSNLLKRICEHRKESNDPITANVFDKAGDVLDILLDILANGTDHSLNPTALSFDKAFAAHWEAFFGPKLSTLFEEESDARTQNHVQEGNSQG